MSWPILEFDKNRKALIEPDEVVEGVNVAQACVLCFFQDVIEGIISGNAPQLVFDNCWEDGPHPVYEMDFQGRKVAFYHPGVGAALAAGLFEEVIALGCRKFIAVGGCGVIDQTIGVGDLVVIQSAVRDEGTSYHYLPPARDVIAQPNGVKVLEAVLKEKGIPYRLGKSWTTDAPYRETPSRIAARRAEGCSVVEMEAAALMAVAEFRGVQFGQLVYGGDNIGGEIWEHRDWGSRRDVREKLFWVGVEAALNL